MNRETSRPLAGWIMHPVARWVVLVVTLLVMVGLATFASKLSGEQQNDMAAWLPGDAESTKLAERATAFAPEDEIVGIAAYVRSSGIESGDIANILADVAELEKVDGVTGVTAPSLQTLGPKRQQALAADPSSLSPTELAQIRSEDGQAFQLIITFTAGSDGWETLPDTADQLRAIIEKSSDSSPQSSSPMRGYLGGPLAFGADQGDAFAEIDGVLLLAALVVVVVMLLLTYRSPILWLIPLLCGVLSVFAAEGLVYLVAAYGNITVNGQSAGILAVIVLGASIDYALLLVARYREELRNFESRFEAMAHALHRATPAILASGATVIIGLLCLVFAELNSTSGMGPVIATGISAALVVMLIILPLVLVVFGRWIFWPFIPRFGDPSPEATGFWARIGALISRRPRMVWVITASLLAIACIGVTQLNSGQLANEDTFTTEQKSTVADRVIAKHYPAGEGAPLQIVANPAAAAEVSAALDTVDGLVPGAQSATGPTGITKGGTTYFERTMVPASDSPAADEVVRDARAALSDLDGADALVGGQTAMMLDITEAADRDNKLIIPLILGVVLIILGILLRAIVAPIVLLATVVLSFGAALGISAVVFRNVFGFAGVDTTFALFSFVFLVALGIDYNIFLMTRIREEATKVGTQRGALIGLAATGGVITSAGLVLAGTFASLATLPIVFLAQIGFTVALGVLLDTLIVRSVLVTSLTLDIGRSIWWPSTLARADGEPAEPLADSKHGGANP